VRRSPATLRKLRCVGGGPRFRRLSGKPYYVASDLEAWIEQQLSEPFASSSEADAATAIREAKIAAERRPPAAGQALPPRRGRPSAHCAAPPE
jgi:hypothetical protein